MASKWKVISRYSVPFTVGTVIGSGAASLSSGRGCPVFCYVNQKSLDSYFSSIPDGFRGLSRFCNCAVAFVIVAADYKLSLFGRDTQSLYYQYLKSKIHHRSAVRLRKMCCENGGCFVKVAQHLGSLDYLIPSEYVEVMRVLHSKAPYSPIDDVKQVLREELGRPVDEIFESFNEVPCGAASLAQAHKARLKGSKEDVVVKVQHKNVKKFAYLDMKTMEFLVGVAERFFPDFKFRWLVEVTKQNLPLELDFLHEADNCEQAEKIYNDMSSFLKFPKIFRSASTSRVLTMEFCEGHQVDDVEALKKSGIDGHKVVDMLGKLYSEMIFTRGFMHCDPHPGNLLVQKNPKTNKIKLVLLDHGLYQQLNEQFRIDYCRLWLALISGDQVAIQKASQAMGTGDQSELFACMVSGRSWESVNSGKMAVKRRTLHEESQIQNTAAQVVPQMTGVLDRVPRQLLLVLKTNDLIRSIQTKLGYPSDLSAFMLQSKACFWALAYYDFRRVDQSNISLFRKCYKYAKTALSLLYRLFQIQIVELSFMIVPLFHKEPDNIVRYIKPS